MQIRRMAPLWFESEQVTNDDFNIWFPHVSPDGQMYYRRFPSRRRFDPAIILYYKRV